MTGPKATFISHGVGRSSPRHPHCTSLVTHTGLWTARPRAPLAVIAEGVLDADCIESLNGQKQEYALAILMPRGPEPFLFTIDHHAHIRAGTGQYTVVNPPQISRMEIVPLVSRTSVHFGQTLLREVREALELPQRYGPFDFDVAPHPLYQEFLGPMDTLKHLLREPDQPGAALLLHSAAMELLIRLIQHHESHLSPRLKTPPSRACPPDPRIRRAMDYLQDHLREDISLEDIAGASGLSVATLYRQFITQTHTTPWNLLRQQRVALAAELLKDPSRSVEEVAHAVGFKTYQGLRAAFLKVHGTSPVIMRKHSLPPPDSPPQEREK